MFNFFLLNEAIDLEDLNTFKNGFQELITIKSITSKEDNLLKHASIWTLNIWPVFYVDNSQYVSVISKFVEQLNNNSDYLNDESTFDSLFPKMCNSFLGIDFSKTTILSSKWIKCKTTFEKFKKDCATAKAYLSINNFWEYPIWSIGLILTMPYWRLTHFYLIHRLMHPWRIKGIPGKLTLTHELTQFRCSPNPV